jgi:hypothetical protein
MNGAQFAAMNRLAQEWHQFRTALKKLRKDAQVRPNDAHAVFRAQVASDSDDAPFEVGPFVVKVPERASAPECALFIAVAGHLTIRKTASRAEPFVTQDFSTKVGYFRAKGERLEHVWGAHYDFAEASVGHPLFHAQADSMAGLSADVVREFRVPDAVDDAMGRVLKTVRVPSAQLDVFSLLIQICADHLLYKDSSRDDRRVFNGLLDRSSFLHGAGSLGPRLLVRPSSSCFRAGHWYPNIA